MHINYTSIQLTIKKKVPREGMEWEDKRPENKGRGREVVRWVYMCRQVEELNEM